MIKLTKAIAAKGNADSLYTEATSFFKEHAEYSKQKQALTEQIDALAHASSNGKPSKDAANQIETLNKKLSLLSANQQQKRQARLTRTLEVCLTLLSLISGNSYAETELKSAKLLGTLLLLSPGTGKSLSVVHQRLKPVYKAVLSIQFVAQLESSNSIRNNYLVKHQVADGQSLSQDFWSQDYTQAVVLPIMLAAIFQDVGLMHPDAMEILEGNKGNKLNPFRILEPEQRNAILSLNNQYTMQFLNYGLGVQIYKGHDKEQKVRFDRMENERLAFQQSLVSDAGKSKKGVAEIIKVPQIYTSIVLSTKQDYKRSDLPKAALILEQMANKGAASQKAVDEFIKLVGYFPQGYGVCFIPETQVGGSKYEYAIVNQLSPTEKQIPKCKIVTKKLMFTISGKNLDISIKKNLHFATARKSISAMSQQRVTEIMGALTHNFNAATDDMPLPSYWEPHEMFISKGLQNIWS